MQFSLVIPVYNSAETIHKSLSSLKEFVEAGDEILVVDDGSQDESPRIAERHPITLHKLPGHLGPATARNTGARMAKHPWLLFLDSDGVCEPGTRERLLERVAKHQAVQGIYAPIFLDANLITQYQNNYYHYVFKRIANEDSAVCATFFFAVRHDLFQQAGGFDESITVPTVEDEQLGYLLFERNVRIRVCPELQVHHLPRYELTRFISRRFRMAYQQSRTFMKRDARIGLPAFLRMNALRKTHHMPSFLLGILLLPVAYVALAVFLLAQNVTALVLFMAGMASIFALNAGLLSALMRLSSKHRWGLPLLFLLDLHVLCLGIAGGFWGRFRRAGP